MEYTITNSTFYLEDGGPGACGNLFNFLSIQVLNNYIGMDYNAMSFQRIKYTASSSKNPQVLGALHSRKLLVI